MRRVAALIAGLALVALAAFAQAPDEAPGQTGGDGFLVNLLQNRLSAPGRTIQLGTITGALSSQARITDITVSDDEGPWLRLSGVEIDWSRAALLLGRVNVNRLGVERIDLLRRPVPHEATLAERLPQAEATPFRLPELPVSVALRALDLRDVVIGEAVFGQAADLSVAGRLTLAGGVLDTVLDVQREDGRVGGLDLALAFSNATRELSVDLDLREDAGGLIATALDIENRPAIALRVAGAGPLEAVDVAFGFDAGSARIATGNVSLRGTDGGLGFSAEFRGGLAPVVPAPYRAFFAGETVVGVRGESLRGGGVRIEDVSIDGAVMAFDGALETTADGFPRSISLSGRLGDPRGPAVTLPVPGAATRLHAAVLYLAYGGGQRWSGRVVLDRLVAGEVEIEDLTLALGGLAENLDDPARRNVTAAVEGIATGVWSPDADLAALLGTRLDLFADLALPPEAPPALRQVQLSGNGLSVFASGVLDGATFRGRTAVRLADITPASGLAGRALGGAVDLRAEGSVSPVDGIFDLAVDGTTEDLRLGDPRLDGLLQGTTQLDGALSRDTRGLRAEGFRIANDQVEIAADGQVSSRATAFEATARIADLAAADPRLGGAVALDARVQGSGRPVAVELSLTGEETTVEGRALRDPQLGFSGRLDGAEIAGSLRGTADFDGAPLRLAAEVAVDGGDIALRDLVAGLGANTLTGGFTRASGEAIEGSLALAAPDLATVGALVLTELSGAASAQIGLAAAEPGQGVTLAAEGRDLVLGANRIGALQLDADVVDAFGTPLVAGTASARDLVLGGVEITALMAQAERSETAAMALAAQARLAIGTRLETSATLERLPDGLAVTLATLGLTQDQVSARLTAPATLSIRGDTFELSPLALDFGTGRLSAQGRVAERIDIALDIETLPLGIANAVQPGLGLEGAVSGTARIAGLRTRPDVVFDLAASALASAQTRAIGLPPARLGAQGRTEVDRLRLAARLEAQGLDATADGTLPLGAGALALDLRLAALPLGLLDRIAGNQGLAGTITGSGRIGGTTSAPTATFDLKGSGITARIVQQTGIRPLGFAARGGFAGNAVTLEALDMSNDQGLALAASGRAPLAGPGLDLRARGSVPLSLANALLAERTAEIGGLARVDLSVTGARAAPLINGTARIENGSAFDPNTNVRLEGLTADATFDGRSLRLQSLSARVPSGGEIAASGSVSLDTAAGNPADLEMRFRGVRYTDGVFVTTRIDGDLALDGPLVGGGVLSGRIDLGPTEISVAEGLGGAGQAALDMVVHQFPPPRVQATLDRARVGTPRTPQPTGRSGLTTDVLIRAPNQIFVRGRGLDVELGGELRVTGPVNAIVPVGAFSLRRGRIQVLGQRIDFDEGALRLTGNLDPEIDFVARTRSDDVTALITVSGRVSAPEIAFSSMPELPQDEVLARIIFNRSVGNLSAFQIAQLASAAAELAGAGGATTLLDTLRGAIGFDDLDIVTEEDGDTAVRAGTYIDDNIYLDLEAEQDGDTRARVNLDLNDNLTLRGSVGSDGNSTLGVFFERDY